MSLFLCCRVVIKGFFLATLLLYSRSNCKYLCSVCMLQCPKRSGFLSLIALVLIEGSLSICHLIILKARRAIFLGLPVGFPWSSTSPVGLSLNFFVHLWTDLRLRPVMLAISWLGCPPLHIAVIAAIWSILRLLPQTMMEMKVDDPWPLEATWERRRERVTQNLLAAEPGQHWHASQWQLSDRWDHAHWGTPHQLTCFSRHTYWVKLD